MFLHAQTGNHSPCSIIYMYQIIILYTNCLLHCESEAYTYIYIPNSVPDPEGRIGRTPPHFLLITYRLLTFFFFWGGGGNFAPLTNSGSTHVSKSTLDVNLPSTKCIFVCTLLVIEMESFFLRSNIETYCFFFGSFITFEQINDYEMIPEY